MRCLSKHGDPGGDGWRQWNNSLFKLSRIIEMLSVRNKTTRCWSKHWSDHWLISTTASFCCRSTHFEVAMNYRFQMRCRGWWWLALTSLSGHLSWLEICLLGVDHRSGFSWSYSTNMMDYALPWCEYDEFSDRRSSKSSLSSFIIVQEHVNEKAKSLDLFFVR